MNSFVMLNLMALLTGSVFVAPRLKLSLRVIGLLIFCAFGCFVAILSEGKGTDVPLYLNRWEATKKFIDAFYVYNDEYLFWILGWFIRQFTESPQIYLGVLAIMVITPIFLAYFLILNRRPVSFVSMYLFCCTSTVLLFTSNVLRQGIAAAFGMMMISASLSNRRVLALICGMAAYWCHKSSIVLTFASIFSCLTFFKSRWVLLIAFGALFLLSSEAIDHLKYAPLIGPKILFYLDYARSNANLVWKLSLMLVSGLIFVSFESRINNYSYSRILRVYLIIIAISSVLLPVPEISKRILMYSVLFLPVLWAELVVAILPTTLGYSALFSSGLLYALYVLGHPSIAKNLGYYRSGDNYEIYSTLDNGTPKHAFKID